MRGLQRRWNRGKRFRSGEEIPRSSLINMELGGELILEVCLGLLDVWKATYGYLRCCHRLCQKGEGLFIQESIQRIQENRVNIGLSLISLLSFLLHIGFWSSLVPTESCFQGVSNAAQGEMFGEELMKNVRGYWEQSIGKDADLWCLPNPAGPTLGCPSSFKSSPSVHNHFLRELECF